MIEDHVKTEPCPECGEEVTSKGKVEHAWEHDEWPFDDQFPRYYICRASETHCYLKVERDIGPYYMAWSDSSYVDSVDPFELMRHDWEYVDRDNTPFPRFEE